MLEELRLRGLGVIDDAVLELGPGFTAITGETGAGKTMVLTGLGLLLGARGESTLVRPGHDRVEVEGRIRLDPDGGVAARATDAGAALDDGVLIVARSVSAEGRSRAHVGGRAMPVGVLAELADDLVTVHGQADQRGLLRPAVQRNVLDTFGGALVIEALSRYRNLFSRLSTVQAQLLDVTTRRRERAQEADLLRFGLGEIDAIAPLTDEDTALRLEITKLAHVDALRLSAEAAHAALSGAEAPGQDALTLLASARRALDDVRGRDEPLDDLATRLAEVCYLLSDVTADLAAYAEALEADPRRLEAAQARLGQLTSLTRKYAPDVAGVLGWADDARTRLGGLGGDDERVAELTAEHEELLGELAAAAAELSRGRSVAARRLADAATGELTALAMPHAQVQVDVRQRDDAGGLLVEGLPGGQRRVAFGASGVDDVELLLTPHAGAGPRPLHRGASGGELSRVMLALEVVLAGGDPVPTFVFDEVDAGVGGRAAVELGRRLALLARTSQVIVVTHLPQVAAFADSHLVVRKRDDGCVTTTGVRSVTGAERLEELSRMLAGLPDSALGRGHAEELLAVASAAKQSG
ncbi:MAG: repair protein RecN [Frankiaceae bacterium]|nr:repair protein RecN [Frankiaceae bacterium]